MSIKINYLKKSSEKSSANQVIFADEKFKGENLNKHLSSSEHSYISDLLRTSDLNKNILVFEVNSKKK